MSNETISLLLTVIFGTITILTIVITAWINARVKIASLEVKITTVEKGLGDNQMALENHKVDYRHDINRMYNKQDETLKVINEVKVELQNKADKP